MAELRNDLAAWRILLAAVRTGSIRETALQAALPAAKHIFTHIEWLMSGVQLHVPVQSAPAGYVWASREQLRTTYALPGAFRAYKPLLL